MAGVSFYAGTHSLCLTCKSKVEMRDIPNVQRLDLKILIFGEGKFLTGAMTLYLGY